jgi:hypothetical protein
VYILREYYFTIACVYVIIGLAIFPLYCLYYIFEWGLRIFQAQWFWGNLTLVTYPSYTILYIISVTITMLILSKKRKTIRI